MNTHGMDTVNYLVKKKYEGNKMTQSFIYEDNAVVAFVVIISYFIIAADHHVIEIK